MFSGGSGRRYRALAAVGEVRVIGGPLTQGQPILLPLLGGAWDILCTIFNGGHVLLGLGHLRIAPCRLKKNRVYGIWLRVGRLWYFRERPSRELLLKPCPLLRCGFRMEVVRHVIVSADR